MLNSTTLEVAIGMALVYLVLSLFCTAINEAVAGILGLRGKNLEKGIRSLFTDGLKTASGADGTGAVTLAQAIYDHGLVQSLYRSTPSEKAGLWAKKFRSALPSYIPTPIFSSALLDVLFPDIEMTSTSASTATGSQNPAAIQAAQAGNLTAMLTCLEALPQSKGKEAIVTLVKQAGGDIAKTRQSFESWYDAGMDRAAGWYKRNTQKILLVLGLIIAVGMNVDSIELGRALWISPAIRSYTVATAEQFAHDSSNTLSNPDPSRPLRALQSLTALPIGWTRPKYRSMKDEVVGLIHLQRLPFLSVLVVIVGWLFTAIAMTLGAPFWFDTLSQFMVIRSTIKPQEKS
jgi:hypothetical protein